MAIFTTFDAFITSTNGTTVGQGECWDYINLIWSHLDSKYWTYPPSDPTATNHGVKYGILNTDAFAANQISGVTFISSVTQVKRGDIVITSGGTYGHAGFINEDYNANITNYKIYSQNYAGRRSVALDQYSLDTFIGAFRYDEWNSTPPTPLPISRPKSKDSFPWQIYARKLRDKR